MSKDDTKPGQKKIKLKTGLRRGNIASVAGETVEVGPGLAQRLVDRGQAEFATRGGKAKKPAAPDKEDSPDPVAPKDQGKTQAKVETGGGGDAAE